MEVVLVERVDAAHQPEAPGWPQGVSFLMQHNLKGPDRTEDRTLDIKSYLAYIVKLEHVDINPEYCAVILCAFTITVSKNIFLTNGPVMALQNVDIPTFTTRGRRSNAQSVSSHQVYFSAV